MVSTIEEAEALGLKIRREVRFYAVHPSGKHEYALYPDWNLQEWDEKFENQLNITPIPMLLTCPVCDSRHIDEGEWATKSHKTHLCEECDHEWRPANVATVGVHELP